VKLYLRLAGTILEQTFLKGNLKVATLFKSQTSKKKLYMDDGTL
jgi:hypothetical protein